MADLLDVSGAAQYLSEQLGEPITVRWVRRHQSAGRIAFLKLSQRRYRYRTEDLDAFIASFHVPAKESAAS